MTKNKKIGICVLAGCLLLCLVLVLLLGGKGGRSKTADPQPPDAKNASDVFEKYVHTDAAKNGSYVQVTILRNDKDYVMLEKYRDVGGRFFYKLHELSDFDADRFGESLSGFKTVKKAPDMDGAYVSAVVTFQSKNGSSEYQVEPFDITGYGIETSPDDADMVTNVPDDCNRLMPVSEISEKLAFTSNAELGGYLKLVYDQVVNRLYEGDAEARAEAWHTVYGFSLKDTDSPEGTYVMELSCDKGIYDVFVTNDGYVYNMDQIASAEDANLAEGSVTKTVD